MSKLLDRLERVNRGPTASLGFGAAARVQKVRPMALIGTLSDSSKAAEGASNLAKIGADGALIDGLGPEEIQKQLAQALDNVPWGVRVPALDSEQVSHHKEQGCDFLAFEPERASLGALGDEDTAYILSIQPDTDDRLLRAIEALPVDAVLLPFKSVNPPLTIEHLLAISSVRRAFSKYLLLELPGTPTSKEMEALRDIGVNGLIVDTTAISAEKLQGLHEGLLALPKRKRDRYDRAAAILPGAVYQQSGPPSRREEEEEEEDY